MKLFPIRHALKLHDYMFVDYMLVDPKWDL